jgi:predicted alpha/beta-fold hydrolase
MKDTGFYPPAVLRNAYLQSILSSNAIRAPRKNPIIDVEREILVDGGNDVRLLGLYSPQTSGTSKGLIIFLHGWEGSAASVYILSSGYFFYNAGYDIFRLNFRDHGESHRLNKGLFLGTLIDEAFRSVQEIARPIKGNVFLMGYSMGGNFALRIARRCAEEHIENLRHIACISPPLDPHKTTAAVDEDRLFRWYFLRKWKRSLRRKQELYPSEYDFTDVLKLNTCLAMTDILLERYTNFSDRQDYFGRYTLLDNALMNIAVPTTIITAEDDPVIPATDFHSLKTNKKTRLIIHRYGGHNGFIEGYHLRTWYDRELLNIFDETQ